MKTYDVIIVGAGPVGLLIGNLLGQSGIATLILEKRKHRRKGSRAISITPPSLQILGALQLDKIFIHQGVLVRRAVFHGDQQVYLGNVRVDRLPSQEPYITVPQAFTEKILEKNLRKFPSVSLLRGKKTIRVRSDSHGVTVLALDAGQRMQTYCGGFLCGCDGTRSIVRKQLGIPFHSRPFRQTYVMGDYRGASGLNFDVHFYLTALGAVESFPLLGEKRRWVVETPVFLKKLEKGYMEAIVRKRAGIRLDISQRLSQSPFGAQHYRAADFYKNRMLLAGDAAHVMSPIGGLGMNTGWADARFCVNLLEKALQQWPSEKICGREYQRLRQREARAAMLIAGLLMRLETLKGKGISRVRAWLVKAGLRLFRKSIPLYFSMLKIPLDRKKIRCLQITTSSFRPRTAV
jgi:2-polyprenyl-6-methoxyphenol hydroxylase-like FAD-dependent oxidoreductase